MATRPTRPTRTVGSSLAAAAALAAAAGAAAGCRKPAPPPPPPKPEPVVVAPPAPDAAPVAPDVCHASVGWRGEGFEVVGLPCVSRDGAEVVFAKSDERPRYPDLTVLAVTRADKLSRYAVVMESHEGAELLDAARRPTPELQARLVKANVLLDEASQHAVPLAPFAPTPAGTFAGQGIEVAWTVKGRVTISREGRFVYEGDYSRWLEQLTSCAPPSYLDKVWGDAGRGVLLVKIAYRGSGGCTAMPELHVLGWSP
jgi:hypothetical protein